MSRPTPQRPRSPSGGGRGHSDAKWERSVPMKFFRFVRQHYGAFFWACLLWLVG